MTSEPRGRLRARGSCFGSNATGAAQAGQKSKLDQAIQHHDQGRVGSGRLEIPTSTRNARRSTAGLPNFRGGPLPTPPRRLSHPGWLRKCTGGPGVRSVYWAFTWGGPQHAHSPGDAPIEAEPATIGAGEGQVFQPGQPLDSLRILAHISTARTTTECMELWRRATEALIRHGRLAATRNGLPVLAFFGLAGGSGFAGSTICLLPAAEASDSSLWLIKIIGYIGSGKPNGGARGGGRESGSRARTGPPLVPPVRGTTTAGANLSAGRIWAIARSPGTSRPCHSPKFFSW
jgi:hypothetical protein